MTNNYYDQKQKATFVLKKNGNYGLSFLQQNNQLIIIDIDWSRTSGMENGGCAATVSAPWSWDYLGNSFEHSTSCWSNYLGVHADWYVHYL